MISTRQPGERRRARSVTTLAALALGAWSGAGPTHATEWQSAESIRDAAEALVRRTLANQPQLSVEARGVDERIRLPACPEPLEARTEQPLRNGQGTVTVACTGGQTSWKLFVPVRAILNVRVLVAARNLSRGTRVTPEDLSIEVRPSSVLPVAYFTGLEQALGLTARRTIPQGAVLVPAALDQPRLVQRGSVVTLVAGRPGVFVKSEGVALEDATLNQRVRVKTRAGRVVEGTVDAQGQVRVGS